MQKIVAYPLSKKRQNVFGRHLLCLNTMILQRRPFEQAFSLCKKNSSLADWTIELRSKRTEQSDLGNRWTFAHHNSSFDILNHDHVLQAYEHSQRYHVPIHAVSAYVDLSFEDLPYAKQVLTSAALLADSRPIIIRFLGSLERSGDYFSHLQSLHYLLECAHDLYQKTESHLIIAIEVHQGTWPQNLEETCFLVDYIEKVAPLRLLDFFGIIDDPANRYIVGPELRESYLLRRLSPHIVHFHLKNVKKLPEQPAGRSSVFQDVGKRRFTFNTRPYEWAGLLEGDLDVHSILEKTLKLVSPFSRTLGISTEYVPATDTIAQAQHILDDYIQLLEETTEGNYATPTTEINLEFS